MLQVVLADLREWFRTAEGRSLGTCSSLQGVNGGFVVWCRASVKVEFLRVRVGYYRSRLGRSTVDRLLTVIKPTFHWLSPSTGQSLHKRPKSTVLYWLVWEVAGNIRLKCNSNSCDIAICRHITSYRPLQHAVILYYNITIL